MDIDGNINSRIYKTRIIPEWRGSALLQTSPNRVGFIGRDILCDLNIIVELDSVENITKIIRTLKIK